MHKNEAQAVILDCLEKINRQLPEGRKVPLAPGTALIGEGSGLDSLGFINLLVLLEEEFSSRIGADCALVDEDRMAEEGGPYASVANLAEWIVAKT